FGQAFGGEKWKSLGEPRSLKKKEPLNGITWMVTSFNWPPSSIRKPSSLAAAWLCLAARMALPSFLQGEDGIRYWSVTGVQTCALPILDVLEAQQHELPALVALADLEEP